MEEQVEMVGKAFVDHYYHLFDNDRAALSSLYQPNSMMSLEGQKILGLDDILSKLSQLPFHQCRHMISTIDSQPSSAGGGGILVFVSGTLHLPGQEHHLRFSQMFHLIPTPQGSFYVQNDIFRLNYDVIHVAISRGTSLGRSVHDKPSMSPNTTSSPFQLEQTQSV